jgi:chromosome segregation ATPase
VVYAHNEDSYKARYQQAQQEAAVARENLQTVQSRQSAEAARTEARTEDLREQNSQLEQQLAGAKVKIRELESQLADARRNNTEINSKLATLASSVEAAQGLTDSLISELRTVRSDALAAQRQKVELDEALRDVTSQLEVAHAAREALQEQLQQLEEEHAKAMETLSRAYAEGFRPDETYAAQRPDKLIPDKNLEAKVLQVRRNNEQTLVEIEAGSRDGVKVGWGMYIGHGGKFIANIRIIEVDINRSVGVVELKNENAPAVSVGQTAYASAGAS